jgi:HD-like signal output (HDOD) protein
MANSPLYRGLNKITGLRPAISRLGTKALSTLLMHESLRAAMFHRKGGDEKLARYVWRQSLASACIARALSRFTRTDPETAFLVGLLHDIGNVIVLRIVCEEQMRMRYEIDFESFNYLCYECHQEFGELIADAWSLPVELRAIICDHHKHPEPDDPHRTMRLQLRLTEMICSLLAYSPYQPYKLLESRAMKDLGLSFTNSFMAFLESLPEEVDAVVEAL